MTICRSDDTTKSRMIVLSFVCRWTMGRLMSALAMEVSTAATPALFDHLRSKPTGKPGANVSATLTAMSCAGNGLVLP